MRFVNFIAALAAVASITSALQDIRARDIPSADTSFVARRAPGKESKPAKSSSRVNACNSKKASHKLRFMPRGDTDLVAFDEGSTWYVYEGGFLAANRVAASQYSRVFDVSGCSAAFFFDKAGKSSSAHITAGNEHAEATEAAHQAKAAGTTDSVEIHAPNAAKSGIIKGAIRAVLPRISVIEKPYVLNTQNRHERWQFTHQSGDRSNTVTAETYQC